MLAIGLTGGIGSGKSTVAEIFKVLGIPVFDADSQAKRLMDEDPALRLAVQQAFGEDTYTNGKLNRKILAELVFGHPFELQKLNAIVHPVTIRAAKDWMMKQTAPYVIKEAALLFEAGSASGLDYIIGVSAPVTIRINRVMQRDHVTRQQVQERMDRQINDEIKMRLCDFILINNEQQLLTTQVLDLHHKLLALSQ